MALPFTNVQCHSQTVGHRNRSNKIVFHKICNVTYLLLVIGTDVIRLLFTKYAITFTFYWSWKKMQQNYLSQIVTHFLFVTGRKRCGETMLHKMCNVTHKLLVMGKYVMRLPFTKCAMSLTCCCTKGWLADISDLGNDRPMLIYPWV